MSGNVVEEASFLVMFPGLLNLREAVNKLCCQVENKEKTKGRGKRTKGQQSHINKLTSEDVWRDIIFFRFRACSLINCDLRIFRLLFQLPSVVPKSISLTSVHRFDNKA